MTSATAYTAQNFILHLSTVDRLKIAHAQSEDRLHWLFHNIFKHDILVQGLDEDEAWDFFITARTKIIDDGREVFNQPGDFPAATTI